MEEATRGTTDRVPRQKNQGQSDATSKETVEDLEEAENSSSPQSSTADDQSLPSPDGEPGDTLSERAAGSDKSGPM